MQPHPFALTLALALCPVLPAQERGRTPLLQHERQWLYSHGLDVQAVLKTEAVAVPNGGAARGTRFLSNLDLLFDLDFARAGLWDGGRAFLYLLDNRGGAPSELVGDVQVTSNIEADSTFKIYEAYYEHSFPNGGVSVLAGLHDFNSEFYALESTEPFLQSSFGIGPELCQVSPSIFPTTALALRLRVEPAEDLFLQYAVYDGVPGNPRKVHGTHIALDSDDGLFHALELGHQRAEDGRLDKLAVGTWYLDRDFEDPFGVDRDHNFGAYAIAERTVAPGVTCFAQMGFAAHDRNEIGEYYGTGVQWAGFAQERPDDVIGIAVAHARSTGRFRRSDSNVGVAETAIELTWRAQLRPWLVIQPDVQYVIDPGMDRQLDDALVFGLRCELTF